ncbi:MAG: transporter substrate-binding domain-containing protein [Micromonosporaceae bacterium]|nr:transporter substrate-binding domain-containing protein [Micromonosporaceae bacterium]
MRIRTMAAVLGVAALILSGCGQEGGPGENGNGTEDPAATDKCESSDATFEVDSGVTVEGSKTFDKISKAGKVVVGVKADQPFLGYKDTEGNRCGFDIELAQLISAKLGVDPSKIEYKEIPSENRETALQGGEVDYYVGTYSITDERKQKVSFAGPYFIGGQDLLVRKDDDSMKGPEDLKGKKVCSATGSTSIQRIRDEGYSDDTVEFKTYSDCVSQLLDQKVDAVTTDDAILMGYASQAPDSLKVLGNTFSEERYGVGLPKGDKAMCEKVSDILKTAMDDGTWQKIYDGTLGLSGTTSEAPKLDDC